MLFLKRSRPEMLIGGIFIASSSLVQDIRDPKEGYVSEDIVGVVELFFKSVTHMTRKFDADHEEPLLRCNYNILCKIRIFVDQLPQSNATNRNKRKLEDYSLSKKSILH